MQKCPRQSQPLTLAAGKSIAQFAYRRVVAFWKRHNKIVDGSLFTGSFDLFVGGRQFGNPQVVFDAVVEQLSLLGDKAFQFPQVFWC